MKNRLLNSALVYAVIVFIFKKAESADRTAKAASVLQKEIKDYLRVQPMSPSLKSFIQRFKRNQFEKRTKRSHQELDENNLFVYDNGNLVPFKNMKKNFDKRSEEDDNDQKAYTVVPLIIPVHPKSLTIKTRTLPEDIVKSLTDNKALISEKRNAPSSSTNGPSSSESVSLAPINGTGGASSESGDEENGEDSQVLHKILEDVEGLMQWKSEGHSREGVICNINGSWVSEAAGMRFDICYNNSTRKKFRIHLADRIPPNDDGFFCDGNWSVFGELPFQHSGVVIVLAVHPKDKHIATFIGECRTCEGSETVSGAWLVSRSSRDCKDQKATARIFSDVWRREQVHNLRKKHLLEMGLNVD